jgi:hypothetical protein
MTQLLRCPACGAHVREGDACPAGCHGAARSSAAPATAVVVLGLILGCGGADVLAPEASLYGAPPMALDGDGDGFGADADCNDTDAGVNPGAQERPGDAIDADCDGHPDPVAPSTPPTPSAETPPATEPPG